MLSKHASMLTFACKKEWGSATCATSWSYGWRALAFQSCLPPRRRACDLLLPGASVKQKLCSDQEIANRVVVVGYLPASGSSLPFLPLRVQRPDVLRKCDWFYRCAGHAVWLKSCKNSSSLANATGELLTAEAC